MVVVFMYITVMVVLLEAMRAIDDSSVSSTGVGNLTAGVVIAVVGILGVARIIEVHLSCSKLEINELLPSEESKV